MKFRRKPIIVEAVQWWPPGDERHVEIKSIHVSIAGQYVVSGIAGQPFVRPGNMVILDNGYPVFLCTAMEFAEQYEPVEEALP